MILDRSDQNAPNQASRFTYHVYELKDAKLVAERKADVRATFTVDSPIPTICRNWSIASERTTRQRELGRPGR
jgi:hypothetical protein